MVIHITHNAAARVPNWETVDIAALGVSGTFQKAMIDTWSLWGDTIRWKLWTDKETGWLTRDKDRAFSYCRI